MVTFHELFLTYCASPIKEFTRRLIARFPQICFFHYIFREKSVVTLNVTAFYLFFSLEISAPLFFDQEKKYRRYYHREIFQRE